MNLRTVTLKYLGWCPGVEAAARFIPDREIPNRRLKQASYIGGLLFLSYLVYNIVAPPRSYAWDLDFNGAKYDEAYKMYVVEASGRFDGVYSLKMWADAPENTSVLIVIYEVGNENYPRFFGSYRNKMFNYGGQEIGTQYESEWELHNVHVWRIYSESRETVFHIRLQFLKANPSFPHGPR